MAQGCFKMAQGCFEMAQGCLWLRAVDGSGLFDGSGLLIAQGC